MLLKILWGGVVSYGDYDDEGFEIDETNFLLHYFIKGKAFLMSVSIDWPIRILR
jgi:hypothetical protein